MRSTADLGTQFPVVLPRSTICSTTRSKASHKLDQNLHLHWPSTPPGIDALESEVPLSKGLVRQLLQRQSVNEQFQVSRLAKVSPGLSKQQHERP